MSFFYFRQLTPPTTVDHSIKASFTGENDINLLVSKSNLLEVYICKVSLLIFTYIIDYFCYSI